MKVISEVISKIDKTPQIPSVQSVTVNEPPLTGEMLIQWLKAHGAKPLTSHTKRRLKAAGHWGMPKE